MEHFTKKFLLQWQQDICSMLLSHDNTAKFQNDCWQSKLGSGESRIIRNSNVFESAGVNFSHVSSNSLPAAALPGRTSLAGKKYTALGVSTVIHPHNPYIPTSHANLRFFIVDPDGEKPQWWFGGGFDLTPYYGFVDDCVLWHKNAKVACDSCNTELYSEFKAYCDKYFYLPNRNEQRGIGGIFFDNFARGGFDTSLSFCQSVAAAFIASYNDIIVKRVNLSYGERERQFQLYRRGRYVEFNLLYDRGTKFGLDAGGRTESILMSLPPKVSWSYNYTPNENTPEQELTEFFLKPRDWLSPKIMERHITT